MQRLFKQRVLAPDRVFAEMPAVVTPEHDDGVPIGTNLLEAL